MKAVVQRVIDASVNVDGAVTGNINSGLLVYLGVAQDDGKKEADWLSEKIINLRIFDDENGVMNLSLLEKNKQITAAVFPAQLSAKDTKEETKIGVLVVSQFTLLADARKGRRPSWNGAALPDKAKELYEYFISKIKKRGLLCESGVFQACMKVKYTNDGPVTILLDTETR